MEWFIRGTEPEAALGEDSAAGGRITYPPAGAVFALDPDMPRERQRIVFSVQGRSDGLRWVLNGRDLGLARAPTSWAPAAGRYVLALSDGSGASIDTVWFQVRGPADSSD